jgi:hypothetical protein
MIISLGLIPIAKTFLSSNSPKPALPLSTRKPDEVKSGIFCKSAPPLIVG